MDKHLILIYFNTLRHLKPVQIRYRIFYFIRKKWRQWTGFFYALNKSPEQIEDFYFLPSIERSNAWHPKDQQFIFLNISHSFGKTVDWKLNKYGKLWTYNLHYFEYLTTVGTEPVSAILLLEDFIKQLPNTAEALEPYPISLRLLFWIRFFNKHQIRSEALDQSLYAQAYILVDNLEYHLLGNHLLENGFGLLFAAYRYQDSHLWTVAEKIIRQQLTEQILEDGGHFERSPMYHQIILYRLLDSYNLVKHNNFNHKFRSPLLLQLSVIIPSMLGWLNQMTFRDGSIPHFNDSTADIAPSTAELSDYALKLGFQANPLPQLNESGYRNFRSEMFELIIDAGNIGPDYQPGHAHCDTLSFELQVNQRPLLVNTGISTYEKNKRRQHERSTTAHNTVQVADREQSEVWGGFRTARRAKALILRDEELLLTGTHTGYDLIGTRHIRSFGFKQDQITIYDLLEGRQQTGVAYFHFYPGLVIECQDNKVICGQVLLYFKEFMVLRIENYQYATGFNSLASAQRVVAIFKKSLEITIQCLE